MSRDLQANPREAPLAFLDVETTGLDPWDGHRVITLCVLHGTLGEAPDRWTVALDVELDPGRPVPAGAAAVHGYTDEVIADLRKRGRLSTWARTEPRLAEALRGRIPLGHHLFFDAGFIRAERQRAKGERPTRPARGWAPFGFDSRLLAELAWPGERHSLSACAARLGLHQGEPHTARQDARLAGQVAKLALSALGHRGFLTRTVAEVLQAQERAREEVEQRYRARHA